MAAALSLGAFCANWVLHHCGGGEVLAEVALGLSGWFGFSRSPVMESSEVQFVLESFYILLHGLTQSVILECNK